MRRIIWRLVMYPTSNGAMIYANKLRTRRYVCIGIIGPPLIFTISGERTGINNRPNTAITSASSTLASAIPLQPINMLEQDMAPTKIIPSANFGLLAKMVRDKCQRSFKIEPFSVVRTEPLSSVF